MRPQIAPGRSSVLTGLGIGVLGALSACGDADVDDTGWIGGAPPDVQGTWQSFITGATGCEGQHELISDWAQGYLAIESEDPSDSSDPSDLTFEFRDGIRFTGWVDEAWSYQFTGTLDRDEASLSVYNAGLFLEEDDTLVLAGDFDVEVDWDDEFQSTNCTLVAEMEATRLSER